MEKKFASPVEQVALAGVGMCGDFVFVGRDHELSIFFFDLAQQIVQFRCVFQFQQFMDQLARIRQPPRNDVSQGQIVAVVVGGRIDPLGLLEIKAPLSRPVPDRT